MNKLKKYTAILVSMIIAVAVLPSTAQASDFFIGLPSVSIGFDGGNHHGQSYEKKKFYKNNYSHGQNYYTEKQNYIKNQKTERQNYIRNQKTERQNYIRNNKNNQNHNGYSDGRNYRNGY